MPTHTKSKEITHGSGRPECGRLLHFPYRVAALGADLRQEIIDACQRFEAHATQGDKTYLRALHLQARQHNAVIDPSKIRALFIKYRTYFRQGHEIDVTKISPSLKPAIRGMWSDLFMVTRSFWSLPYNKGYGRRLRFVVFDEYHEAVMGIIGLQSPPADLSCRDELFSYPAGHKLSLVNSTLDAYTVGSVPPYSFLLGGKLCAGLISSDAIRQGYWSAYAGGRTEMANSPIQQPLVAVTTTSAFGRSSMYNRLRYKDRLLAEPIGYTQGFGTLHLEHLYDRICEFLKMTGQYKPGGFGVGPKVRWQNITNALIALGLSSGLLKHGVRREVFLFRLVDDLERGMSGRSFGRPISLPEGEYASYWRERWALPRAARFPDWNSQDATAVLWDHLLSL